MNHPAHALVVCACIAVIAIAFFLTAHGIKAIAQAIDHIGDYQSGRMFRRLGKAAAQKAAEESGLEESGLEEAHREFLARASQDGDQS